MGNARWKGVRLRDLLDRAGVKAGAVDVGFSGLDRAAISATPKFAKALGIVVIFLKNPDQFNLMNPLAFNPAAFMDQKTASKFIYTLASGCDLFVIWVLILTVIGLKAAAGKKLSTGAAAVAVVLPGSVPGTKSSDRI